jgi:hypothetical protein
MADIGPPSIKDVSDFTDVIANHPVEAVVSLALLTAVALVIGYTSKLPTAFMSVVVFLVLGFLLVAGSFGVYRLFGSSSEDTAVVFGFKLADDTIRLESVALNTYIGGVDGDAFRRRVLFRSKDGAGDWVNVRTTRVCSSNELDGCPPAEFKLPVWLLLKAGEARHFRDGGAGTGVVVTAADDESKNCTVFAEPKPTVKPRTYSGPDLCPTARPKLITDRSGMGSWLIGTAWAQSPGEPQQLAAVRAKLASPDAKVRTEGRADLQKASNAAELLGAIVAEPVSGPNRDRAVANALIAGIYIGDDKWQAVSPATRTRIIELLADKDELVSRYAKSVLRRYADDDIRAKVKAAAQAASGEQKTKLTVALADIEYNLGVVRLVEARSARTDPAKWQAALDLFKSGLAEGNALPDSGKHQPDVMKNHFGVALAVADKWSMLGPGEPVPADIKRGFEKFLASAGSDYPYSEQVDAATCTTKIATTASAQYSKDLGACLKYFR